MVSRKANQRKAVKKPNKKIRTVILLILLWFIIAVITITILLLFKRREQPYDVNSDTSIETETESTDDITKPSLPNKINFQSIIDDWNKKTSGNKSVLIYDLERDETVGELNPDTKYNTASLYKLFVVYEGYRRLQTNVWQKDTVSANGHTILECLDLAIRESYSPCAESLWAKIGHSELDKIIQNDFKIAHSDISNLSSNPRDIMAIMKLFYYHKDISNRSFINRMKDSFLNQPATTYDWRQGLPSGFKKASVYNKVGWDYNPDGKYWNIYHDAAIVEFPDKNRHFIVVVMTNRVPFEKIRQLGTDIEKTFYK